VCVDGDGTVPVESAKVCPLSSYLYAIGGLLNLSLP